MTNVFFVLLLSFLHFYFWEVEAAFKTLPWRKCLLQLVLPISSLSISVSPRVTSAFEIVQVDQNDVTRLKRGLREITFLLDNWDEKTTYCNFGEFQRELLAPDKKKELFEAAAKNALWDYDKTATMNVMCKRDPQVVRAFLGLTPENVVLNQAEKLMKKPETLDLVDSDNIDSYFEAIEKYTTALASVNSLAYEARTDYTSTETFSRENAGESSSKNNYLEQSRQSVIQCKEALERIVNYLGL